MALQGAYQSKLFCGRQSHRKYRYCLFISDGVYVSLSFDHVTFLQAEIASIWFLEHIIQISKSHSIPANLICLGKTLWNPVFNLIHWLPVTGVGHYANTAIQRQKNCGEWLSFHWKCLLIVLVVHQVPPKCFSTREICLKFQKISMTNLGVIGLWMKIFWLQRQLLRSWSLQKILQRLICGE